MVVVVLLVAVVGLQSAPPSGERPAATSVQQTQPTRTTIPKLFDFALYRKLFRKTYSSIMEQMIRAKLFMSRSIRAFISALKFSHGEQDYFLAINHLSDQSKLELDLMRNKVLDKLARKEAGSIRQYQASKSDAGESQMPEFVLEDGVDGYKTLVTLLEARKTDPFFAEMLDMLRSMERAENSDESKVETRMSQLLQSKGDGSPEQADIVKKFDQFRRSRRMKRDVNDSGDRGESSKTKIRKRKLPLDRLINLGTNERLSLDAASKVPLEPESNNDNYEQIEPLTNGMADNRVPLKRIAMDYRYRKTSQDVASYLESSKQKDEQGLDQETTIIQEADDSYRQPDSVIVDLRETSCLLMPRDQGKCGSCYAFAAITLLEYLYCMKTHRLLSFSEQYVIDCGKAYFEEHIFGCNGGHANLVPEYFQNFGAELRSLYPYRARDDMCPYEPEYNRSKAGFIRMDLGSSEEIPRAKFMETLKYSPIIINVKTAPDFTEYGGGVHPGMCTNSDELHTMLLVGHGVEGNQRYWLIRNSYSVGWGEGGYYKMWMYTDCIHHDMGWIFGSNEGKKLNPTMGANPQYDEEPVQMLYFNNLAT